MFTRTFCEHHFRNDNVNYDMRSYCALRNTNIIFPKNFFYYFMYLQFKIWLIRKIRLTDTKFLYIVNITTKIPNFNTEYQAMSLQCRKNFEFENSKFSNCWLCAKKKHTAKCLVCRVPSCSTRRSILFAVCQAVAHGEVACLPCAAHGKVERRQPPSPVRSPPPHVSGTCTRFAVCFEGDTRQI